MASKARLDVEVYHKALTMLKSMIEKMVPIKKTQFCTDRKVAARFFKHLQDIGAITPLKEVSAHREGTRFDWTYNKASNEAETALASRIIGLIYQDNVDAHAYYSSDKYKRKKAQKEYKESEKEKNLRLAEEKKQRELPKQTATPTPTTETIPVEEKPEPHKPPHKAISFNLSGDLTKEELLEKIGFLITEATITSFKVEVSYK
jgi:hypothetical protein